MEEKNNKQKIIIFSAVFVFLLLALFVYFSMQNKPQNGAKKEKGNKITSGSVIFEQPNLFIFNERQILNQYPDKIRFHYPYLLVITPGDYQQTSTIYSISEKRKIKVFRKVLFDYFKGDVLSTDGKTTFFNNINLNIQCSQGFIKDKTTIFCLTPKENDPLDNKLISINPQNLVTRDFYSSDKLITTFSLIHDTLFLGEEDTAIQKTYLRIGNTEKEIPTQADSIYQIGEKTYYATFMVSAIGREASYYLVRNINTKLSINLIEKGKIIYYE